MSDMSLPSIDESCIAVIGLGYVGLPLALEFSKKNKIKNTSKYRRVIKIDQQKIIEKK